MTTYRYMPRSEWGFRVAPGRTPQEEAEPDSHGVLHHVGGAANMGNNAAAVFRQLNTTAINKGHWGVDYDALGHYDFANDVFTLGQGNWAQRSAATLDFNEQGEALCMCGNYELRPPHHAEVEGAAWSFAYMVNAGLIVNPPTIIGHYQNPAHPGATACPGKFFKPYLPTIRDRVAELLNVKPPPPQPSPTPPPGGKWLPGEPQTAAEWMVLGASLPTPPGSPVLAYGLVHPNVTWWQAVMSSMPTVETGSPIYNPEWIAFDHIGDGPAGPQSVRGSLEERLSLLADEERVGD